MITFEFVLGAKIVVLFLIGNMLLLIMYWNFNKKVLHR